MNPTDLSKALFEAIRNQDLDAVQRAIDQGAPLEGKNGDGWRPLQVATFSLAQEVVLLLVRNGANLHPPGPQEHHPAGLAMFNASKQYSEMFCTLLGCGADVSIRSKSGETLLHKAATNGRTEDVRALLERGLDANIRDAQGNTPLHALAGSGMAHDDRIQCALELVRGGADLDAENDRGCRPIHLAVAESSVGFSALLVALGASTRGAVSRAREIEEVLTSPRIDSILAMGDPLLLAHVLEKEGAELDLSTWASKARDAKQWKMEALMRSWAARESADEALMHCISPAP